jgi:E3 ubiquitin-protein ligase RNF216
MESNCACVFSAEDLRPILEDNQWKFYQRARQHVELRDAKLESLESCPFCDYAVIIEEDVHSLRVFQCENPVCRKTSCRLCKKASHLPLRCEEFQRNCEVGMRVFVAEKMTEALVRTCYSCNMPFFKEEVFSFEQRFFCWC